MEIFIHKNVPQIKKKHMHLPEKYNFLSFVGISLVFLLVESNLY